MLRTSNRKDYLLRMIEELQKLVNALLGRLREGGDPSALLAEARTGIGELLGPLAGIAPRMDSVTAGQMVGDADVLEIWARVTAAEGELAASQGDAASAAAANRRALELALEAHLRTAADRPELLAFIAGLRQSPDSAPLHPRHAEALAALGL